LTVTAADDERQVRLLISDTDPSPLFSTTEIADFLAINADSVRRAAAQALDTIASNEALVSKKITTQDLQTDGPAVAASLRQAATELRRQADAGEGDDGTDGFEIVEYKPYPYHVGWRI
jgi:chromosomal replication initiation ATPase DnaA